MRPSGATEVPREDPRALETINGIVCIGLRETAVQAHHEEFPLGDYNLAAMLTKLTARERGPSAILLCSQARSEL